MKKIISILSTLVFAIQAQATLISLDFNQDQYQVGDNIVANIVISEIETQFGFQKSLGGFSMGLNYDASLVSFNQVTFGDKLNGGDPVESMTSSFDSIGRLFLEEISFSFDLFSFQNGIPNFILATIEFTALSSGQATPTFDNIALTNDFGAAFTQINSSAEALKVGAAQSIPEPHMLALLLPFALMLMRKRK